MQILDENLLRSTTAYDASGRLRAGHEDRRKAQQAKRLVRLRRAKALTKLVLSLRVWKRWAPNRQTKPDLRVG